MTLSLAVRTVLPVVALAGCANTIPQPQDYSPGYSYVATDSSAASGKGVGSSVLAPNACLVEPADGVPAAVTHLTIVSEVGPHLPPGCANAYNLQRMAESQRDLIEGRRMGPAAAGPTVRAARQYLYGNEAPIGGATQEPIAPEAPLPQQN